jgi:hypothetical protein
VTEAEFDAECKKLCPHCAAGENLRWRESTSENVHDFSFGPKDPKLGRSLGMGHSLCQAHAYREANKGLISG